MISGGMNMKTNELSLFIIYIFLAIPQEASTQQDTFWTAHIERQLGFKPDVEQKVGDGVSFVPGKVIDPTNPSAMGLEVQDGDRIQIIGVGNDKWQIKHIRTGKSLSVWYDYGNRRYTGRPD
jgi:hypothetical protein